MADMSYFNNAKLTLVEEIKNLLANHDTANYKNALVLNQTLQKRLQDVLQNLNVLLKAIQEKYAANKILIDLRLQRTPGVGQNNALLRGGTFYFKGNMYFRDDRGRGCPNTADYEQRCQKGEMFPMDFNLRARHIWTINDKSGIIRGIKTQIIEHLEVFNKRKLSDTQLKITVHEQKLAYLLKLIEEDPKNDFQIDWMQVSAIELGYRHGPTSCEAMWNKYLHPKLNRNAWSSAEEKSLVDAVQKYNFQDWPSIAGAVGNRSDYQCFVHFKTKLSSLFVMPLSKWTQSDDERLLDVIYRCTSNSVINWAEVMLHFPGRPKTSLICRYFYSLNPRISHEPFKAEEDLLLLAAVDEYKGKFFCFPRTLFPNRTLCQLRSRYHNTLTQRNKVDFWSTKDDEKLMSFVAEHGSSSWQLCAKELGNHTRISCRTRFMTIEKFLIKNPQTKLENMPRRRMRQSRNGITVENWTQKLEELYEAEQEEPTQKTANNRKRGYEDRDCAEASVVAISQAEHKKQRPYRQSLRVMQAQFYNFFKYAYNLRTDEDVLTSLPPSDYALRIAVGALKFAPLTSTDTRQRWTAFLPLQIRDNYAQMLRDVPSEKIVPEQYKLPPSWSTAVAFRALCIHTAQKSESEDEKIEKTPAPKHDAILLFRQRLRTLVYNTILLSRLRPSNISGLGDAMQAAIVPATCKTLELPAIVNLNAALSIKPFVNEFEMVPYKSEATFVKLEPESSSMSMQTDTKNEFPHYI